jgi:hypothetical protein
MKLAILCAVALLSAPAYAETIIIEYPDHYYVELIDTHNGEPAKIQEREKRPMPAKESPVSDSGNCSASVITHPVAEGEGTVLPLRSKPVMSPELSPQPVKPVEQRVSMKNELQRLQSGLSELTSPKEMETAEQAAQRQRNAEGALRKIRKLSSKMLNTSDPGDKPE